jgi:predicted permease
MRGIGIGVDFYAVSNIWSYISAILILRAIFLLISIGWAMRQDKDGNRYIGQVTVNWLALTWISTVILGVPIAQAVFGDKNKGFLYGLLAGISSFIFQLPFQLLFLECYALEDEFIAASKEQVSGTDDKEGQFVGKPEHALLSPTEDVSNIEGTAPKEVQKGAPEAAPPIGTTEDVVVPPFLEYVKHGDVWRRILSRLAYNPVLWGIGLGFFLSLSTIGPRFLKPSSDEFVPGLEWFYRTCKWMGAMVLPLSLFAMGVWMQAQGKSLFQIPVHSAFLYMF